MSIGIFYKTMSQHWHAGISSIESVSRKDFCLQNRTYVRNLSELSEESQSTTSSLRKRMINQLRIGSDIIQEEGQEMEDNFKQLRDLFQVF